MNLVLGDSFERLHGKIPPLQLPTDNRRLALRRPMQAGPEICVQKTTPSGKGFSVMISAMAKRPAAAQQARASRNNPRLVRRKIDHAVRYYAVKGAAFQARVLRL